MSSLTDQLKPLGGYVRVLADDDETQRRLLEALKQARTASRRARSRSPREAVTDRKVQASVRKAGASLGKAAKRMQREQEPPHRARKLLVGVLALAGLGGVLIFSVDLQSRRAAGRRGQRGARTRPPNRSGPSRAQGAVRRAARHNQAQGHGGRGIVKALFTPISIVSGLSAGIVAGPIFKLVWGLIDDEEAPDPKHREVVYLKLVGALLIEGAITRTVRGFVDHGSRHAYHRLTGAGPVRKTGGQMSSLTVGVVAVAGLGGVLAGASKWLQGTPSVGAP